MSRTLFELSTYLELLDIPKTTINKILSRDDILLYSALRDNLSTSELLELQIILKNICNKKENSLDIDFNKFISLDKKNIDIVSKILNLKSNSKLELATIIQLDTKDLSFNIINRLL
jgi:hypothetical protein